MATEYKVGTISKLLAKASGKPQKIDPKLAALFGSSSSNVETKVFRTVKVTENQLAKKSPAVVDEKNKDTKKKLKNVAGTGKYFVKDIKLKNRDAAAIRVDVKIRSANTPQETEPSKPVKLTPKKTKLNRKNNKKTKNSEEAVDDEATESMSNTKQRNKRKFIPDKLEKTEGTIKNKKTKIVDDDNEDVTEQKEIKREIKQENEETGDLKSTATLTFAQRNAPKPKDPELEARTIFVGNLPNTAQRKVLKKMFQNYGKIECVRFRCGAPDKPSVLKKVAINKKELHPDNSTVAAYIRFQTREDAEKAAEGAKGLVLDEHHLVIDLADRSVKKDNKKAIFVGNLNLKLTDEELWRFFEDCGSIDSVRVVRDSNTGMGKGFGYVNFAERSAVDIALQKNQEVLNNRSVRISRCVKKLKIKNKTGGSTKVQSNNGDRKKQAGNTGNKKFGKSSSSSKIPLQRNVKWQKAAAYTGDRLAEIGKLKRKSKKPNRGEIRKAKLAAKLLANPSAKVGSKTTSTPLVQNSKNKKIYFK